MKKIFVFAIFVLAHSFCIAAQQPVSPVAEPGNFGEYRADQNTNNAAIQSNFTELYGSVGTLTSTLNGKAAISCFTNASTMTACFPDLSVGGDNLGTATASTVVALFGYGACSGYLNGDGSCSTPSGTLPIGDEGDFLVQGATGAEFVTPLTPVAGSNITITTDTTAGTVTFDSTGGATVPSAGIVMSDGTSLSNIAPGTGVATALAAAVDGTGGLASKAALDAATTGSFAFDTYPTHEDSAHTGSGIAVNGTTLAVYSADAGKWLTVGLTDSLNPAPDTTPDAFTFGDTQQDAELSTQYCSAAVTPTGFTSAASIVSTGTGSNQGWKIDGGSFATSGTLSSGSAIQTCHDSSPSSNTSTTSSLTIGGVDATAPFTVTTEAASVASAIDDFNRANGGLGSNWTTVSVGVFGSTQHAIVSNKVTGATSTYATSYYSGFVFNDNQYAKVTLGTASTGSTGVGIRLNSSGNGYIGRCLSAVSCGIYKLTAGSSSAIGATFATADWSGQVLELRGSGSTISLYLNGSLLGDRTDSSYTSGSAGITTNGNGTASAIDNFEGGNL